MKRLFFLVVISSVFFSTMSFAVNKTTNVVSKDSPIYTLQLPSNPTTGYSWFIVSYDNSLLKLQDYKYIAKNQSPKGKMLMGGWGYQVWYFKVTSEALVAPRVTTIKLIYARPWDLQANKASNNIKKKTVTVIIR